MTLGACALSDAELLASLLAASHPRADVLGMAESLIAEAGGFAAALTDAAACDRCAGQASRTDLALVREAGLRLTRAAAAAQPVISSSPALLAYVRTELAAAPREEFRVLFLDRKNRLIRDERLGEGTVDHAPVYPREVVRRALELAASALILLHNHPSGDPAPSSADVEMTRQIVAAARALNLVVHDHLVVGREGVASLKALGLM
jgi:DNA repair protein RadC